MERPHRLGKAAVLDPLPTVFERLANNGTHIHRGQATMVFARSGVGKSNFVQYYVTRLAQEHGCRSMYFCADQDRATVVTRMASTLTGELFTTVKDQMREGESDRYLDAIGELRGRIAFSFDPNPTPLDIHQELMAFHTLWGGSYPDVIVIDTLMKMQGDHESEWASGNDNTKFVQMLARETGSAVIVLAHANETGPLQDRVPPKRDITNKLDKVFELILSMERNRSTHEMLVGPVKDRHGEDDPEGLLFHRFKFDFEHTQMYNTMTDWEMRAAI